jgi:diguanylate cyclase (GGDEF)-like protein
MFLLDRALGDLDAPTDRVVRAGRIAVLTFITGGLVAIPANFLIEPENDWVYLLPAAALSAGVACLFVPWRRLSIGAVHALAVAATILVSLSMAVASPAYATYFVFVALFVALVLDWPRDVMLHLALISAGLFVPVLIGDYTGRETLIIALLEAPSLFVVGTLTAYLQARLVASRHAYYTLARQDELTGVGNYRALHERLAEEISRHARHGREMAVIVLDLDGFKQVNERFGHLAGDAVLSQVGEALRAGIRAEDSVFRQGGDEFSVLAPETGMAEAEELAARLRIRLREIGIGDMRISAQTGFAIYPSDGRTVDGLLGFADVHLLAGKREAREADQAREE